MVDPARLDSDFNVAETGAQDGLDWLELTPKEEDNATFQRARLGFDDNGLARMEVVDMLGQRPEIAFSDWKKNPPFADGTFRYTPAEGVDDVGDGVSKGQRTPPAASCGRRRFSRGSTATRETGGEG